MASIRKRGNSYQIRASAGYDIDGKQIVKVKTFRPPAGWSEKRIEKEVQRLAVEFENEISAGHYVNKSIKFADFSAFWMKEHAEKTLRLNTVRYYKRLLSRINAAIGHIRIDQLQPLHLMAFYNNLAEDGIKDKHTSTPIDDINRIRKEAGFTMAKLAAASDLSINTVANACKGQNLYTANALKICSGLNMPYEMLYKDTDPLLRLSTATIKNYHVLISSIMSSAVQWGYVVDNPCKRVSPPKVTHKPGVTLTSEETNILFQCLDNEPIKYKAAIITLVCSGLRRSELCGLKWSDLDFDSGVIVISRKLAYTSGIGLYEDEPKTESGKRALKLPSFAVSILREYRKAQAQNRLLCGDRYETNDYIFVGEEGHVIHPDALHKWFTDFLKKYDLPPITLHSLRHTNASLLIANGVDLATVSKRLGHASTAITAQIYTHAIQEADAHAAEAIDNILLRSSQTKAAK